MRASARTARHQVPQAAFKITVLNFSEQLTPDTHMSMEGDSESRVADVHSQRFVSDMVRGLPHNSMNDCISL